MHNYELSVPDRSAHVWSLLAVTANYQQTVSLEIVRKLTGLDATRLLPILDCIDCYCALNHLPPLSAVVLGKGAELPSTGRDVPGELTPIFEHNWIDTPPPSFQDLVAAAEQRSSDSARLDRDSIQDVEPNDPTCSHCRRVSRFGR